MLKDEGKIDDETINKLMSLRHSGFSVHNGSRIARDDEEGKKVFLQTLILFKLNLLDTNNSIWFWGYEFRTSFLHSDSLLLVCQL